MKFTQLGSLVNKINEVAEIDYSDHIIIKHKEALREWNSLIKWKNY